MTFDTTISLQGIIDIVLVIIGAILFYERAISAIKKRIAVNETKTENLNKKVEDQQTNCDTCKNASEKRMTDIEDRFHRELDGITETMTILRKEVNDGFRDLNKTIFDILNKK